MFSPTSKFGPPVLQSRTQSLPTRICSKGRFSRSWYGHCTPLHFLRGYWTKKPSISLQNKSYMAESLSWLIGPNRFCRSSFGVLAKFLIVRELSAIMTEELDRPNRSSTPFSFQMVDNRTPQKSIILRAMPPDTPFKPGNTIVLGAHMDSVNSKQLHSNLSIEKMVAPGADDNASGVVVLLCVFKALNRLFANKPVVNEVQFHFYGAEEIGLVGSSTVFAALRNQSYDVKAMLNLDMVGYAGGHNSSSPKIALQDAFVNKDLTAFVAKLIETVSALSLSGRAVETSCLPWSSTLMLGLATLAAAIHAPTMLLRI